MAKKKGLGRGLDALLSGSATVHAAAADRELREVPVDLISRSRFQPRVRIDEDALETLAQSIRVRGVVQPVVLRPRRDGVHYELVAGERRWRAAQIAGLDSIPAVVRDIPDEAALGIALIENIQREDLNAIEEAAALRRLIEEFELTHQEVGDAVGRSRAAVSNLLRLLELRDDVRRLLEDGEIEMGHARALLGLAGEPQSEAARVVVTRGLSARETEALVRRMSKPATPRVEPTTDPDVRRLQDDLSERLGAQVAIEHTRRGRGKLVIRYSTLDQLDGILERIK